MAQIQGISTEDHAFNLSEKPVNRIFEFNQKMMNPILAKVMRDEENPIKMLMTECFMEGYNVAKTDGIPSDDRDVPTLNDTITGKEGA